MLESQSWFSPKVKQILKESYQQQRAMSNRLSTPKCPNRSTSRSPDLVCNSDIDQSLRQSLKTAVNTNRNLNKTQVVQNYLGTEKDIRIESPREKLLIPVRKSPLFSLRNQGSEIQI